MELLGEVHHIPLKERDQLPMLKVDKSLRRLVKTTDAILKVVTPTDQDITTINQLQYTGEKTN